MDGAAAGAVEPRQVTQEGKPSALGDTPAAAPQAPAMHTAPINQLPTVASSNSPLARPGLPPSAHLEPTGAAAGDQAAAGRFAGVRVRIKEYQAMPTAQPGADQQTAAGTGPIAAGLQAQQTPATAQLGPGQVSAAQAQAPASQPVAPAPSAPTAARAPRAATPRASAGAAAADIPPIDPDCQEEVHVNKPQWRKGWKQVDKTEYLFVTLTPSDCTTKRMRPPRAWFDALLGGVQSTLEVQTETGAGKISFLLQSVAYDYAKNEYYVQGQETKRMFRALGLQPGDGLKLQLAGTGVGGQPVVAMTLRPAAANPHAPAVVGAANEAAKRRAEAAALRPPKPAGEKGRKRKGGPASSGGAPGLSGESDGAVRGKRYGRGQQQNKFGEDFVVASGSNAVGKGGGELPDQDYVPLSDEEEAHSPGETPTRKRKSDPGPFTQPIRTGSTSNSLPQVTAIHAGERNLLRIRMPAKASSSAAAPGAATAAAAPGDPSHLSDALAGRVNENGGQTAKVDPQTAAGAGAAAAGPAAAAAAAAQQAAPISLLKRSFVRDTSGVVAGANCKFSLAPGSNVPEICRTLSAWGLQQRDTSIDDFEAVPAEQVIKVQMMLQPAAMGKSEVLDAAVLDLTDSLNRSVGQAPGGS